MTGKGGANIFYGAEVVDWAGSRYHIHCCYIDWSVRDYRIKIASQQQNCSPTPENEQNTLNRS